MKVVVVGIDGADWKILEPLLDQGKLPTISKLMEEGSYGDLDSISPPVSPPAWASILTGVNPGKHGIFDFTHYDSEYSSFTVNNSYLQAMPIWRILNDNGVSTGLVNVPLSYPPKPLDGYLVTGMLTPGNATIFSYPRNLGDRIGDYASNWRTGAYLIKKQGYQEFADDIIRRLRNQTKFVLTQSQEFPTDFQMIVFDGSDRLQHFLWRFYDKEHPHFEENADLNRGIAQYYTTIDCFINELLQSAGDDINVFIISDHGFRAVHTDFHIEQWLKDNGYLETRSRLWRMGATITSEGIKKLSAAVRRGGAVRLSKRLNGVYTYRPKDSVKWHRTTAFFTTAAGHAVKINLRGRERNGIVTRRNYEDLVDELREKLLGIQDITVGSRVIEGVYRRGEIYSGPFTLNAPDLLIECTSGYALQTGYSRHHFRPSSQYGRGKSGDHSPTGIIIAWGPNIARRTDKLHASIMDIAPTILYMSGSEIPTYIDGQVLTEILREEYVVAHKKRNTERYGLGGTRADAFCADEERAITEHLRNLGYL